jgi:hypothetical protein
MRSGAYRLQMGRGDVDDVVQRLLSCSQEGRLELFCYDWDRILVADFLKEGSSVWAQSI